MTTEAPTTGSTTSTADGPTRAEQAARLLAEPLPADVRIAMIQQVLHETGQALAVLQTMANLLAGPERPVATPQEVTSSTGGGGRVQSAAEAATPGEDESRATFNARRLAEVEADRRKNGDLAHLLLSMLDESGAPQGVPREEYLRLTRAANYANPGAVTRIGYVKGESRETSAGSQDICYVTDKGLEKLREYGFHVG